MARLDSSADRRVCRSSMFPWKPAIWWLSAPMPACSRPSWARSRSIRLSSEPDVEPDATDPTAIVAAPAIASAASSETSGRERAREGLRAGRGAWWLECDMNWPS